MKRALAPSERVAWLRLLRTPRIGPLTFHRLIAQFGSPHAALNELPRLSDRPPPTQSEVEDELAGLERLGARLIASCEPDYPPLLAELDAPPPALAVRGDATLFQRSAIALVGSREGSAAALTFTETLARDLGQAGHVIVSGLARGIDAAAHRGSLETGAVAVLAGGLDHPYPPQNLKLHAAICERGAVVTEAPLGANARARDFPRRNSIISGLSRAVVVIEAALRSGSLITARAAADQGRDVMAVPGSPLDPRARGSNALIKQGAALVEGADDVLAALGEPTLQARATQNVFAAPAVEPPPGLTRKLASLLSPTPVHANDLARLCEAPVGAVVAALIELELEGRAASLPGGYAASSGAAFG
jgi:DNA processing protein